jgi:uncharacterized protein (TIGR00369 family)
MIRATMPTMADDQDSRERRAHWNRVFAQNVPHNVALGLEILDLGPDWACFRLPYAAHLVGNPETGVLHGGAITAMLDACSGAAVFAAMPTPQPIATLDLRIDYLRPGAPGQDVLARATCYRVTRNVAFTRAVAYHDDPDDPIAAAAGTFMLATKAGAVKRSAS